MAQQPKECDLLIVGGGPAGLSAAINGASEGLNVMLLDSGPEPGGQASKSSLIENYPGFPDGISGGELIGKFLSQANKFKTQIVCPQAAIGIQTDGDRRLVITDDEELISARAVLIAAGLSYRRLAAPGIGPLMGRGVLYGAPTTNPELLGACTVCIVGGANSAGQAAMHLSSNPNVQVKMLVRRPIKDQMSQYLVDRVEACESIEVIEGVEVREVVGKAKLETVVLNHIGKDETSEIAANHLFIFIGASPKTMWLNGSVALDERKFILTGNKIPTERWTLERPPLYFETSMPGVFAAGDVRLGSTKRITGAAGEGSAALQECHELFRLQAAAAAEK